MSSELASFIVWLFINAIMIISAFITKDYLFILCSNFTALFCGVALIEYKKKK